MFHGTQVKYVSMLWENKSRFLDIYSCKGRIFNWLRHKPCFPVFVSNLELIQSGSYLLFTYFLSFFLFSFFRNITFPTWNSLLSIKFPFIFLAHSISSASKLPPHLAYFSSSAYYSFSIHLKPFVFNPNPISSAEFLDTQEQDLFFLEKLIRWKHNICVPPSGFYFENYWPHDIYILH